MIERYTFASHLVMAAAALVSVKELPGYKTIAMTLRNTHLELSHKIKAVALLDFLYDKIMTL